MSQTYETATNFIDTDSSWVTSNYSYSSDILRRIYLNQDYIYQKITGRTLAGAASGLSKHAHTGTTYADGQALLGIAYNQQITFNSAYTGARIINYYTGLTNAAGVVQGNTSNTDAYVYAPKGVNKLGCFAHVKYISNSGSPDPYFRFDLGGTYVEYQLASSVTAGADNSEWIHVTKAGMLAVSEDSYNAIKLYWRTPAGNCDVYCYGLIIYYDTTLG